MASRRQICIHGHFYQPPRENPWLEVVEAQESAAPHHDWNERVCAECYAPNSAARILGRRGTITDIVNNYESISFNFGPTLLFWLQAQAPWVHEALLAADRASLKRLGAGNALAQVFNHVIMPLATSRDKATQVRWGARDFELRFGRRPQGMWLAEAAVDQESLAIMAAEGIAFTILAPGQCAQVRPGPDAPWQDVSGARVDPRRPYKVALPEGGEIAVFFYDGPASQAVAFEHLLDSGEALAGRVRGLLDPHSAEPQLASLATDGESYGHHHPFGEMALAYALDLLERDPEITLTNFAAYLREHPPVWEAQIVENSSWSCIHGVERWRSDCGCGNLDQPGWNQAWRAPLRDGLNALKVRLDALFDRLGGELLSDPWAARDQYVDLLHDRSEAARAEFLARHQRRELSIVERVRVNKLLESQRLGMYMFTSCGWFFDDLAGLEPVQNLRYAARALRLAQDLDGGDWEGELLGALAGARSNHPEEGSGADIWRRRVAALGVGPRRVAAHVAISAVVGEEPPPEELYSYRVETLAYSHRHNLGLHLSWGRLKVAHRLVGEEHDLAFAALHTGGHDFKALVQPTAAARDLAGLGELVERPLRLLETHALWEMLKNHLGDQPYTLGDLFLEGRRELALAILERGLEAYRDTARAMFESNREAMLYLREINVPLPRVFTALAEVILAEEAAGGLLEEEEDGGLSPHLGEVALAASSLGLSLNLPRLRGVAGKVLTRGVEAACAGEQPGPAGAALARVNQVLDLVAALKVEADLWRAQNRFHRLLKEKGRQGLSPEMLALGRRLNFDLG
jgi:alpha-amylase/alpha-mannosidase (GH57 family)